tara:strand:- start:1401 stop:1700 length:300 start_codon:yes stop_codon:yes gene_type:complete
MSFNLIPKADRVVIELDTVETKTEAGIIIPDSAKERPHTASVIAVGPGVWMSTGIQRKPDVEIGDKIMFSKYSGTKVTVDEKEYVIIREADIIASFKKD